MGYFATGRMLALGSTPLYAGGCITAPFRQDEPVDRTLTGDSK